MAQPDGPSAGLASLGADVAWTDHDAGERTRATLDGQGAGRLAELAGWLAATQGGTPPGLPRRPRLVTFGPATEALAALTDEAGVGLRSAGGLPDESPAAVAAGAAIADDEIDGGADLIVLAVPSRPVTSAVVASLLTGLEPVRTLARGADAADAGAWMTRAIAVRDTRRVLAPHRQDPDALLAGLADPGFAAAAALALQAAARRTPVLLDGAAATLAALVAYEAQPRAVRWWLAADSAADPGQQAALQALALVPVLDLASDRGDGTAGVLAVTVLRAACRLAAAAAGSADDE